MSEYNKYRRRKVYDEATNKIIDFIFYIPRKLYKENVSFKNWINERQRKRAEKEYYREAMDMIFYYIDKQEKCDVFLGYDSDNYIISDVNNDRANFNFLLDNNGWAIKNKLNFETMTYDEYIRKYHHDKVYQLNYYYWDNKRSDTVIRIRKEI